MKNIPFVEKYRPQRLNDIILNTNNRVILDNILKEETFPNIMLYGPPGTGKTTTIINLIKDFCKKKNNNDYETVHLNASDDRGIDNIRTIIHKFATTSSLFNNKYKFIILDEVDYMTHHAQYCLKNMMEIIPKNVSICLICNYITKIEIPLSNKFIKIYFKRLTENEIIQRIKYILDNEKIEYTLSTIKYIINKWNYDIRSMLNYIQLNRNNLLKHKMMNKEHVIKNIQKKKLKPGVEYLGKLSEQFNMSKNEIIEILIEYYIKNNTQLITSNSMELFKFIVHNNSVKDTYLISMFIIAIKTTP